MSRKFDKKIIVSLVHASKIAQKYNAGLVGTEHLLLGILKGDVDFSTRLFEMVNVDVNILYLELEKFISSQPNDVDGREIVLSQQSKRVLAFACEEALQEYDVHTRHFFVGLIKEKGGTAQKLLSELNIDLKYFINNKDKFTQ